MATVWAEVNSISGREYFSAQQVQSEITVQIWLRYRPDVHPTMRIRHGKRHYEVVSVINHKGRNTALQLMCKEVNDGERYRTH